LSFTLGAYAARQLAHYPIDEGCADQPRQSLSQLQYQWSQLRFDAVGAISRSEIIVVEKPKQRLVDPPQ
jgi:hypothetical protein